MWAEVLSYTHTHCQEVEGGSQSISRRATEGKTEAGYRRQWETLQRQRASLQTWGPQHRYRQM